MSDKSNIQIIENEDAFAKVKKKTNKKRQQTMFLIMILAIPMLNWLVFWLYVNISSFVLAFRRLFKFDTVACDDDGVQGGRMGHVQG